MIRRTGTNQTANNNNPLKLLLKPSLIKTMRRATCPIFNRSLKASLPYLPPVSRAVTHLDRALVMTYKPMSWRVLRVALPR